MKGQAQIIAGVIALVTGVIGITIVYDVVTNQGYTGTLKTVTDNIALFMGLGLLGLAGTIFLIGFRMR